MPGPVLLTYNELKRSFGNFKGFHLPIMFGLGQKRSRVSKSAAVRRPNTMWSWLLKNLKNQDLQLRLGLCLVAMILLVIALQSWQAPFPFRQGEYSAHGISAKIPFERVDKEETERARDRAEELVPYVFKRDSTPLKTLPEELRAALGQIAQAKTLEELAPEIQNDFGISEAAPETARLKVARERYGTPDNQVRFQKLREAVVGPDMTMADVRIEKMVDEFSQLIAPIIENGIVDPDDERRQQLSLDRRILIVDDSESTGSGYTVLLPQVRIEDQLNEAGQIGKSWAAFPALTESIQQAFKHWLFVRVTPTLRYDQAATKTAITEARNSVEDRIERFIDGDLLVRPGELIDEYDLALLRDEYDAVEANIGFGSRLTRMGIVLTMVLVLAILNGYYIFQNDPRLVRELPRFITYLTAIVLTAFIGQLVSFDPLRAEIIPLLTVVVLISIAYNQFLATLTAFSLSILLTLSTTGQLDQFIVLMSTATAAIIPLQRLSSRAILIKVSFASALTYFLVSCGVAVVETQSLAEVFQNTPFLVMSIKGAALCLVAGFLVAGSLPFVESAFGIVTDMTLLELSDPSHPLLQDLVRLAPGTYNHSISVASVAETAAERIGANGLLVRVGAYFHDIGKMLKPQYFIENVQSGCESRHGNLNPTMSTLIIIGHVKDGIELAEQHGLPDALIDFIEEHHGTTLVEYFYREATKLAESSPDHKTDAEESSFRYPGPKPQSKETGILMISDACESACRTLTEPTPKRIEGLVNSLIMRRLQDGQFDECDLKMSELHTIQESIVKSLIGIYHGRIRYPDQESRTA